MNVAAGSVVTVYTVFADTAEADRIATAMIARRLAACANILAPCRSVYRWRGAIETATEIPALFKTDAARADALVAAISDAHSYDVPAVVRWDAAAADPPYAAWIADALDG